MINQEIVFLVTQEEIKFHPNENSACEKNTLYNTQFTQK